MLLAPTAYHRLMRPDGESGHRSGCRGRRRAVCRQYGDDDTARGDRESRGWGRNGFNSIPSPIASEPEISSRQQKHRGVGAVCSRSIHRSPVFGTASSAQASDYPGGITAPYFHHVDRRDRYAHDLHATHVARCVVVESVTQLPVLLKGVITWRRRGPCGGRGRERCGGVEPRRAEPGYSARDDQCPARGGGRGREAAYQFSSMAACAAAPMCSKRSRSAPRRS